MKILAIDVGVGTQDIMLYDSESSLENSYKLVLPSPTRILAEKIRKVDNDLLLDGETMGGGPINRAILDHLKKGKRVLMTRKAARTVRDDLDYVKAQGIEITPNKEDYPDITNISLADVDLYSIKMAFHFFGVKLDFDYIGVAVQDHGYKPGIGDRNFRFKKIKEKLKKPIEPERFAYNSSPPQFFSRMQAVYRTLKNYPLTIMDSKFASICGATCDPKVKNMDSYVVMDVGNGHTLAASMKNGKIFGLFEHHTRMLNPEKIDTLLEKLAKGSLTHKEVHSDGGHGAWVAQSIEDFEQVIATGPQRQILSKTDKKVHFAAPAGDVMMTGPVGLIKAIKSGIK